MVLLGTGDVQVSQSPTREGADPIGNGLGIHMLQGNTLEWSALFAAAVYVYRSSAFSGYRADIWATGVCLWVFIYGTLPFMEDTPDELFDAIAEKELEFPSRVSEGVVGFGAITSEPR